jgi:hypothetical protein
MACDCNLNDIASECGRNAPGLKTTLYVACVDDIATIGAASSHAVSTITATAAADGPPAIEAGGFVEWSILRTDNNQESTPGETGGMTTTITGVIAKQTAAKSNILTQPDGNENFIVLTKDQNGSLNIIGALDHPAKITVAAAKSPRNSYTVTIVWEGHADLPFFFTGTPPLKP